MAGTVSVVGLLHSWRDMRFYDTGVGEQQPLVLNDGTHMSPNMDTRVHVELGSARRTRSVERGEALFEVAKDAQRPFVVRVAASEMVALGTVFAVRLMTDNVRVNGALAVPLTEGQVGVRPAPGGWPDGVASVRPVSIQARERVRLIGVAGASTRGMTPQVDWWAATLGSPVKAVSEMNRYSRTLIVLSGDAASTGSRIGGLFRTGDSVGFACRGVAARLRPA